MATRLKTVEYAFASNLATLAANTKLTFGTITISLPETTARTFQSVWLVITAGASVTTSTNGGPSPTIGIKLGAATESTVQPVNGSLAGSRYDSDTNVMYEIDVTSYFTSNFGSGATQTAAASIIWNTGEPTTENHSAKLIITYNWDDTDDTRVKTVRIPLEGGVGALATSLTEIGSSEIPLLDSFCPEASKSFKSIFFEMEMVTRMNGATFTFSTALDAGGATTDATHQFGSGSTGDIGVYRLIWQQNSMATNATHAFKASCSNSASLYNLCVVLVVTYTYTHSTSTSILNSLMIPFEDVSEFVCIMNSVATRGTLSAKWWVEEPDGIVLEQSAVRLRASPCAIATSGFDNMQLRVGNQAYRSMTTTHSASIIYSHATECWQQRFDNGGVQGLGLTRFARGENSLTVDIYGNGTNTDGYCFYSGEIYLNYESGKHANGDQVHNHTIRWLGAGMSIYDGTTSVINFGTIAPSVPEASWAMSGGFYTVSTNCAAINVLHAGYLAGENLGSGHFFIMGPHVVMQNGNSASGFWVRMGRASTRIWDRTSVDSDPNRAAPFAARDWTMCWANDGQSGAYSTSLEWMFTYHSITFTAAGQLTSTDPVPLNNLTVHLRRADTGDLVATTTTNSTGGYSFTWFDNIIPLFTEVRFDDGHVGRSANFTAS